MEQKTDILITVGCFLLGWLISEAMDMHNDKKELEKAKAEFDIQLAQEMNYNSANVKYFDLFINKDEEYILKFTGSAINTYGEELDFFACSYELSEQQYRDICEYANVSSIENVKSVDLLNKLTEIVKEAELKSVKENPLVDTQGYDNNQVTILNVSKAKINGDKVFYNVKYCKPVKKEDGTLGLVNVITEVSYDLTDELSKNPNGVFLLPKEKAISKVLHTEVQEVNRFGMTSFNNASEDRVQVASKGKVVTNSRIK